MLREDTRRKALRMAAKVALGLPLVTGCGGNVDLAHEGASAGGGQAATSSSTGQGATSGSPGETAASSSTGAPAIEDAGAPKDAASAGACGVPEAGPPTPEQELCCEEVVAATFPDDGSAPFPADLDAATPDVTACCRAIITFLDTPVDGGVQPFPSEITYAQLQTCCMAAEYPNGATCTPWGPPVPPAMPFAFDADAWLAEVA